MTDTERAANLLNVLLSYAENGRQKDITLKYTAGFKRDAIIIGLTQTILTGLKDDYWPWTGK